MTKDSMFSSVKRKTNKKVHRNNIFLFPLAFVIIIIPLLVYEHVFSPTIVEKPWFPNVSLASDYFLFYKSIFLMIIGFFLIVILLYRTFAIKQKILNNTFQMWHIPLFLYATLIIISTLVSSYNGVSLNGTYEQFETVLVLLTYGLLLYYSYHVVRTEQDVQAIARYLCIGIGIMTGIGLLQLFGLDPIASNWGKYLISADKSKEAIDAMSFNFEKNRVYMTLLNPNYVGVYASLLFPITMGLTILLSQKKKKIISFILSFLLIIAVFGSQSKTGLIILAGTGLMIVIILRKRLFANKKIIAILGTSFALIVIGFFIVNSIQNNAYTNSLKNAFTQKENKNVLEEIETTNDYIFIKYNGKTVHLRCELNSEGKVEFSAVDESGNDYKVNYDDATMTFALADDAFNSLSITPIFLNQDGIFGCEVVIDNTTWYFKSRTDTEGYSYMNKYGRFDQIKTADSMLFENHEQLFTGRGYLWSRTLPLLKDYIFVGSGPSTFVYAFPQNDYVGKYNNNFDSQVVTKPHNLYLQIAVETGLLSCIAFISLCVMYIVQTILTFRKSRLETIVEQMGVLICIGVVGYMVSGIINDSNVGVAPIFWILLGVGFACNKIIRTEQSRKKKIEAMDI